MNKKLRLEILKRFDRQRSFADAVGVSESIVSDILHGRRGISDKYMESWCAALKCSTTELREFAMLNNV